MVQDFRCIFHLSKIRRGTTSWVLEWKFWTWCWVGVSYWPILRSKSRKWLESRYTVCASPAICWISWESVKNLCAEYSNKLFSLFCLVSIFNVLCVVKFEKMFLLKKCLKHRVNWFSSLNCNVYNNNYYGQLKVIVENLDSHEYYL